MSEEKKVVPETEIFTYTEGNYTTNVEVDGQVAAELRGCGMNDLLIAKIVDKLGIGSIEDLAALEAVDLTSAGMKLAPARRLVADLKSAASKPAASVAAAETRAIQSQFEALLPSIPTDESWLNALKTGGILKADGSSCIAAIRVALADCAGLYKIPDALSKAMEKYADETEEQVDPTFYSLRKSLTRRAYGDIFAAIDGLDGTFITETRRKEFLDRIRNTLWPAIAESYRTLDAWYQTWRASFSDPSMLIAAIGGGFSGGAAGMSMITPPDTSQLHDAGETLVNAINRVFRGTGVQVAAAMAYDANTIRNTLEDPRLPSMVGVKNREMMLKKIDASVSSNYIRLEQNLVKYVLAFAKHDTVTSDVEVNYFVALWQLGTQINWNELGGGDATGITGLTGKRVL